MAMYATGQSEQEHDSMKCGQGILAKVIAKRRLIPTETLFRWVRLLLIRVYPVPCTVHWARYTIW